MHGDSVSIANQTALLRSAQDRVVRLKQEKALSDRTMSSLRHDMRSALDEWQREVGDLGLVPEDIMYRQMYPDGEQPQTLEPLLVVLGGENYGLEESPEGGEFKGPVILQMQSSTHDLFPSQIPVASASRYRRSTYPRAR